MAAEPPPRTPRAPAPGEPPLTVTVGRAALPYGVSVGRLHRLDRAERAPVAQGERAAHGRLRHDYFDDLRGLHYPSPFRCPPMLLE